MTGLFEETLASGAHLHVNTSIIDCTQVRSREHLLEQIQEVRNHFGCLRVGVLDELHRLARESLDETLLKAVEDESILWIGAAIEQGKVQDTLMNRIIKLRTELPTHEELKDWLAAVCDEHGIAYTGEAILRVVDKSDSIPGIALQALALAAIDPDGLTVELVEDGWITKAI